MSERRLFGVCVRVIGLVFLAWSVEWIVPPVGLFLLDLPSGGQGPTRSAWSAYIVAAAWRMGVGAALLRGAGYVVRLAYPGGSGVCGRCGYDIRATPDRCPECGAVAAAADPLDSPPPDA